MKNNIGIPVTGWYCVICLQYANIMESGTTWCKGHYQQSINYLGDKGKTWVEMRRKWREEGII